MINKIFKNKFSLQILICLFFISFLFSAQTVLALEPLNHTLTPVNYPSGVFDVLISGGPSESLYLYKDGVLVGGASFSVYSYLWENFQPTDGPIPDGQYVFCMIDRWPPVPNPCVFPDGLHLADDTGRFTIKNGEFKMGWGCVADCNSNVLFLPGIQGSRLYRDRLKCGDVFTGNECGEKELWLSTNDTYHSDLELTDEGKSAHNDIYTKNDTQTTGEDETGIIDEAFDSINIYESFLNDLDQWKNDEKIIEDYAFIPYDWRLSLEDIITNCKVTGDNLSYSDSVPAQDFSESFILQKLRELQASSRNGKVTLIGHSTGGLVIKALVQKLQETNDPLYNHIDKIILVAVPQVGAPEATIALLHGIKLGEGFLMNADRNRALAENMTTVYNLAPSASYFDTVDTSTDPVITFEDHTLFAPQTSEYGGEITTFAELKDYLLGTDGRMDPSFDDTKHANIVNEALLNQAEAVHQVLDSFTPPVDTKVIQVAGWGEETKVGIEYVTKKKFLGGDYVSYKPKYVIDGDSTVPVPSALWMSEDDPNVERWWVDLKRYNNPLVNLQLFGKEHKDILEVTNLRNFIKSKTTDSFFVDIEGVVLPDGSNLVSTDARLHYTLHSPLTLGITDSEGNYTGLDPLTGEVKNEIADVSYEQIGDVQFLSVPSDKVYTLKLDGYTDGSFALDVEKQLGNDITESTSFQGIPSSENTLATIDITPNMFVSDTKLKLDQNGDGAVDKILDATPEGITVYDITAPEISMTFSQANRQVEYSAVDESLVTATSTESAITAVDEQGNTSVLNLIKYVEKPTRTRLKFNTITRNGEVATFPNTNIIYDWQEKNDELTDLDTIITIKGEERYRFNYKKKQNETTIRNKIVGEKKPTITIIPGFVSVTITTDGDELKITY